MNAILAFITEHWIISSLIGIPTLIIMLRVLRTRLYIRSTIRALYPDGAPRKLRGQPSRKLDFSGEKFKLREMVFYGTFVEKILALAVDRDVVIVRGKPKESHHGKFCIYLGYAQRGEQSLNAVAKLFGIERVWDGRGYGYTGFGLPIMDDKGVIVAEYNSDSLYFLVDPNLYGVFGGARIFAEVLMRVAAEVSAISTQSPAGQAERFADLAEKSVAESLSAKSPRVKAADGENPPLEPDVAWRQLSDSTLESELEALRLRTQAAQELGREYDSLCQVHKVRSVTVADDHIEVYTDTLLCNDPATGAVYEMGRFKIKIPFSSSGDVVWKNQTRQVNGYADKMMALHIYENGKACLGNTKPWFKQLIGERKFADAAKLAILFVETVNPEDTRTYKHIGKWPRVS